jgi:DNA primase RepB-like protein
MAPDGADNGQKEAQAMLDAFASVGATQFELTLTTRNETKESYRRRVKLAELSRAAHAMLDRATSQQHNVIVRPHGAAVTFIQLDDLKTEMLARLAPAVFLILRTSPGNFQAWLAIPGAEDKEFARRLRKGTGADAFASGATRVAGSLNFKDKYAPNFPRVAIEHAQPGRRTTPAELERRGLVAAPDAPALPRFTPSRPRASTDNRKWPSYARCLDGAPLNHDKTGPKRSSADWTWSIIAIDWGWSEAETAARLMEESEKARENGERYAARTVAKAAAAVASRSGATQRPNPLRTPKQG